MLPLWGASGAPWHKGRYMAAKATAGAPDAGAYGTYGSKLAAALPPQVRGGQVVGSGRTYTVAPTDAVATAPHPVVDAVARNLAKAAKAVDAANVAAHVLAVALAATGASWGAVGQALGYGHPAKPRSGASAARAATGQALGVPRQPQYGTAVRAATVALAGAHGWQAAGATPQPAQRPTAATAPGGSGQVAASGGAQPDAVAS